MTATFANHSERTDDAGSESVATDWPLALYRVLKAAGVRQVTYVPDAGHSRLIEDVLWPALAHRVPAFQELRVDSAWAGHYETNLLDHNGIVGPHDEIPTLLFATGFSGHGVMHAPATGRAIAGRSVLARTPIGRCDNPREIASVAAFLAREDASYITGQTIYPDGGRLILNYTVPVRDE
jgi:glycine/D-amino acid oxidase-like deaminating enzyme